MTRLQNFFRKNARKLLLKRAHLVEQAEAVITREAISAQANVETNRAQPVKRKPALPEVIVAARRMHDMKFYLRSFQQLEIALGQFV